MDLAAIIARWQTDEGKPYKGSLIDWEAYEADPENIGCMCAQGQLLYQAGWEPLRLRDVGQAEADEATAKLLNISRAHAVLLREINDRAEGAPAIVLTDPAKVLGDQWAKVLDFWWHLHCMTEEQWDAAGDASEASVSSAWDGAWDGARVAAWTAARAAAVDAAWATNEIQGANILSRDGKPFFFLSIFGFASPDDIPPRPDDYGQGAL